MNRSNFLSRTALGGLLGTVALRGVALADGTVSITNLTVDAPTTVDVRVGNRVEDAISAGGQSLKKGDTFTLPATNMLTFWRREVNPGSGDGKWTDWSKIDARNGDQRVTF